MRKVTAIGGGGVRTPLLIYGLAQAHELLEISELALFDTDVDRAETIARLGREIVQRTNGSMQIRVFPRLEEAAENADFVLSSIRVGGIAARARDERIAIRHGLVGQETTGPAGAAMALRTLPISLGQASVVERVAPQAWFINLTNPAGLITQALSQHTALKVVGICDTPMELFHRIADTLGEPCEDMMFDYAGLNHLGWVRGVTLRGEQIMERLLGDANLLRHLYPADLFDPELIQTLRLIPTEYLFFYYSQRKAYTNQVRVGASRGEELERLNRELFDALRNQNAAQGLDTYRAYLVRRNSSYMRLEAQAESALEIASDVYDPFETVTGYHKIALEVMTGLVSDSPREVIANVSNHGAIEDLEPEDIVEVPCQIDRNGVRAHRTGRLPESIRRLVESVKAYERCAIRAAREHSIGLAKLAMLVYPMIGQWEVAGDLMDALIAENPEGLGYLR